MIPHNISPQIMEKIPALIRLHYYKRQYDILNTGRITMLANIQEQSQYAIGWGTLALINAGLAQAKNRSGLAWFLISLFVGPIATFLIVVLEAGKK